MEFYIYQLPSEVKYVGHLYHDIQDDKLNLEAEGYKKTYKGKINLEKHEINEAEGNNIEILEKIYELLNVNHPIDYKGHNLSVSDIVQLKDKYYHCQNSGWKEITLTNENKIADRYLFDMKVTDDMFKGSTFITSKGTFIVE